MVDKEMQKLLICFIAFILSFTRNAEIETRRFS